MLVLKMQRQHTMCSSRHYKARRASSATTRWMPSPREASTCRLSCRADMFLDTRAICNGRKNSIAQRDMRTMILTRRLARRAEGRSQTQVFAQCHMSRRETKAQLRIRNVK